MQILCYTVSFHLCVLKVSHLVVVQDIDISSPMTRSTKLRQSSNSSNEYSVIVSPKSTVTLKACCVSAPHGLTMTRLQLLLRPPSLMSPGIFQDKTANLRNSNRVPRRCHRSPYFDA